MRLLPAWARGYDRAWLRADLVAGLIVWSVVTPQAVAYAQIAGLPPARTRAPRIVAFCHGAFRPTFRSTTLMGGSVTYHEGETLRPEHVGRPRLLVPHLHFWKSAKWVAGPRIMDHEQPGSGRSTATGAIEAFPAGRHG